MDPYTLPRNSLDRARVLASELKPGNAILVHQGDNFTGRNDLLIFQGYDIPSEVSTRGKELTIYGSPHFVLEFDDQGRTNPRKGRDYINIKDDRLAYVVTGSVIPHAVRRIGETREGPIAGPGQYEEMLEDVASFQGRGRIPREFVDAVVRFHTGIATMKTTMIGHTLSQYPLPRKTLINLFEMA
ncbi:hypothetical protein GOV09_01160 [Candidatus Woesearchaeota archaeon]|nr:hypothetical protein [Candidatus Woesearchaeota archaeon]